MNSIYELESWLPESKLAREAIRNGIIKVKRHAGIKKMSIVPGIKVDASTSTADLDKVIRFCFDVLNGISKEELEPVAEEHFSEIACRLSFADKIIRNKSAYKQSFYEQAVKDIAITQNCCEQLIALTNQD